MKTAHAPLSATTIRSPLGAAVAGALVLACVLCGCGRDSVPVTSEDGTDYRALMERSKERREASARYRNVEKALGDFHFHLGRFPSNLNEIVRAGFIDAIPPPPPGAGYSYDRVSGTFRIVRLPPEGQQPRPPHRGSQ